MFTTTITAIIVNTAAEIIEILEGKGVILTRSDKAFITDQIEQKGHFEYQIRGKYYIERFAYYTPEYKTYLDYIAEIDRIEAEEAEAPEEDTTAVSEALAEVILRQAEEDAEIEAAIEEAEIVRAL